MPRDIFVFSEKSSSQITPWRLHRRAFPCQWIFNMLKHHPMISITQYPIKYTNPLCTFSPRVVGWPALTSSGYPVPTWTGKTPHYGFWVLKGKNLKREGEEEGASDKKLSLVLYRKRNNHCSLKRNRAHCWLTLSLFQTCRANPVQCYSSHQEKSGKEK